MELSRGLRVPLVCKKLGVSEQTYDRWREEYGGLRLDQAKRLKELERENTRLKKLVADHASGFNLDYADLNEDGRLDIIAPAGPRGAGELVWLE